MNFNTSLPGCSHCTHTPSSVTPQERNGGARAESGLSTEKFNQVVTCMNSLQQQIKLSLQCQELLRDDRVRLFNKANHLQGEVDYLKGKLKETSERNRVADAHLKRAVSMLQQTEQALQETEKFLSDKNTECEKLKKQLSEQKASGSELPFNNKKRRREGEEEENRIRKKMSIDSLIN